MPALFGNICKCSWLLAVASVFIVIVAEEQACNLKVLREGSDTPELADNCVRVFEKSECAPFVQTFNRSLLPENFTMDRDADFVERPNPSLLSLNVVENFYGTNYWLPGVSIIFGPPFSDQAKPYVKGYLLVWEFEEQTEVYCALLQVNPTENEHTTKYKYQYDVEFVRPKTFYTVKVYSMPPPRDLQTSQNELSFVSRSFVSNDYRIGSENPGKWYPSLVEVPGDGKLSVKISRSPTQFNLTSFNVMLLKKSFDEYNPYKEQNFDMDPDETANGLVTFSGLEEDTYRIVVNVNDPFHKIDDKCLCWIQETNGRHCRNSCGSVQTHWINITNSDHKVLETTTSPIPVTSAITLGSTKTNTAQPSTTNTSVDTEHSTDGGDSVNVQPSTLGGSSNGLSNEGLIAVMVCVSATLLAIAGLILFYKRKKSGEVST